MHRIYDSPLVEKFVLKVRTGHSNRPHSPLGCINDSRVCGWLVLQYFVDHLHANERPSVRPQMVSWDSLGTDGRAAALDPH